VYGVHHVLMETVTIPVPSWNMYCLGVDLTSSTVSFSVNRNITVPSLSVPGLNTPSSIILNSKIFVANEMFGNVNIYSQALASVDPTSAGNALPWTPSDWKYNSSNSNNSPIVMEEAALVLGTPKPPVLTLVASMTMSDAANRCTTLGKAQLPDPINIQDWRVLYNYSNRQLGPNFLGYLDVWLPYTSLYENSNKSDYSSVYIPGKKVETSLWAPNQPSPGAPCLHCTWEGCIDDDCDLELDASICTFPSRIQMLQLRGLCMKSFIGNK
jgi:hypothetical protein